MTSSPSRLPIGMMLIDAVDQQGGMGMSKQRMSRCFLRLAKCGFFALVLSALDVDATSVKDPPYSAVGDGVTNDAAAFQHALNDMAAAGGGVLTIPTGKYLIGSTLTVGDGTTLQGSGEGATNLLSTVSGGALLSIAGEFAKVRDMSLTWASSAAAPSGTRGIYSVFDGPNSPLRAGDFEYRNLMISKFYDNIYIDASSTGIVSNVKSTTAEHDGVVGLSAQGYWDTLVVVANKNDGIYLDVSTRGGAGASPFMSGIQTFANGGWGIHTLDDISLGGTLSFLNNDSQGELLIDGQHLADTGFVSHVSVQYAGQNPRSATSGYPNIPSAPGIHVTKNAGPVRFTDVSMLSNNGTGLWLEDSSAQVSNVRILGSGSGGAGYCVLDASSGSELTNVSCGTQALIDVGSAGVAIIRGGHFGANSSSAAMQIASGTNLIVADNVFYNGGNGAALSISPGVTLAKAYNMVIGTMINSGAASSYYTPTFQ